MDKKATQPSDLSKLHRRAEHQVVSGSKQISESMTPAKVSKMMHDLETHQIELEMQNEELCRVQDELVDMRDQYTELYDHAPIGYFTTDRHGIISQSNLTFGEMLEAPRSSLVKRRLSEFITEDSQDDYYKNRRIVLTTMAQQSCELCLRTTTGREIWVRLDSIGVENPNGECNQIRSVLSDITRHRQADEELRKLSRALEFSSSAVIITDLKGNIEYVNPKFSDITGYSREEAIGKNPLMLQSGGIPVLLHSEMLETVSAGGEWRGEAHYRKKDGSYYWARDSISGVRDPKGVITHLIDIQDDVTHEFELSEQLSYQATHDTLTGLINRHEFERRVERLLLNIEQNRQEHALCFLDLDQFKVINDTCGHAAGDELLRQLGRVLQTAVRHRDTLGRLGGDEFGVLMEHCTLEQAHRVAMVLKQAIQDYQFYWEGQTFRVGVSIGLVGISEETQSLTELLKQADAACYMAKDLGRNRIHVFQLEDTELALRHGEMQWVARINQALEENQFCFYAQPIISLDSMVVRHYELLLRMLDKQGKPIPPGAFLPAAERYGLIGNLDLWVIKNAFTLLTTHSDFVRQTGFFSINLSGQSLTNNDFLDFIIRQLQACGITPSKICFEITETAAISNLNAAIEFISTLRKLGCRFALDDFGSGLSSFGYLKNLPVDYLKIDGMFVKDIVDDPLDHAMVKSINEIGQVMGMKTIAEFVENDEIRGMLKAIGVNFAQGCGIGEPQPFTELLASLIQQARVQR
jgi:diguanylate cyclase (GGDEF)-like protein/PAS domain S-box-containing protein